MLHAEIAIALLGRPLAARLCWMVRWTLFFVIVGVLGLTLATGLDRQPPVLAASVVGRSLSSSLSPGAFFGGTWSMTAVRTCDGTAERWIEVTRAGGKQRWVYRLPDVPVQLGDYRDSIPGRIEYPITTFEIPQDAPLGPATYNHVDRYVCSWPGNWLFPIAVIYPPIRFEITPSRLPDPAVPKG